MRRGCGAPSKTPLGLLRDSRGAGTGLILSTPVPPTILTAANDGSSVLAREPRRAVFARRTAARLDTTHVVSAIPRRGAPHVSFDHSRHLGIFQRRAFAVMVAIFVVSAAAGTIGPAPRRALAASATTTADLNLRAAASLDAAIVAVMPAGAAVEILGAAESGFYPVSYGGSRGYAWTEFVSTGGGSAAGPSTGSARATADLNLRAAPNLTADVVVVIPSGGSVSLLGEDQNGFSRVSYGGTAGWAYASYLTSGGGSNTSNPTPAAPSAPGFVGSAVTTTDLNLRAGPNTTSDILAVMPSGATVTISGRTQDGFYEVRFQGTDGWAHGDYLSPGTAPSADPAPAQPAPSAPSQGPTGTAYTTADLNLRSGASTSTSVVAVIPSGGAVTLTGQSQAGFYSASYNGSTGWAYSSYLTTSAPAPSAPSPVPDNNNGNGSDASDIVGIIYAAADRYGQSREDMLRVARCESVLDPNAVNPAGSYGLFQFIPSTWASTPYAAYDIFDPWASANAAGWMWSVGRRGEWTCQ